MEQMQGTIYLLQQELKEAKERLAKYEHNQSTAQLAQTPVGPTSTCNGDDVAARKSDDLGRTGGVILKQIKTEIVDDVGLNIDSHKDRSSDQNNILSSDATVCNHSDGTDLVSCDRVTSVFGQNERGGDDLIGKVVTCRASSSTVLNCTARTTTGVKVKMDDNDSAENGSPDCGYGIADSPGQERHRATVGKFDAYRTS